jgi:DNA-binding transcriptional LysR family regulator
VRVAGSWTVNSIYPAIDAALAGFGMAYMPEELALPHIKSGRLVPVLKAWWPTFLGLHIFFANRRQSSTALSLVVEAVCYQRKSDPVQCGQ